MALRRHEQALRLGQTHQAPKTEPLPDIGDASGKNQIGQTIGLTLDLSDGPAPPGNAAHPRRAPVAEPFAGQRTQQ
jgi:hypothetical protein